MKIGVLGAGPAGLFAAWLLSQRGADVTVFEANQHAGGISRSFNWHGFTCDLGAHRLFTNDESVLRALLSLVPMGRQVRRSQIYMHDKWLRDPVNVMDLLYNYFPVTTANITLGYLSRPRHLPDDSFDSIVNARFGKGLNDFFFRPYTEKMFGLSGDQISGDWARRKVRIAGPLDFLRENTKRRFSYFYYPVQGGYGAVAEHLCQQLRTHVRLSTPVTGLQTNGDRITHVEYDVQGAKREEAFDQIISTLPLTTLGRLLGHDFSLAYQGVHFIYLLVNRPLVSENHWVYFMGGDFAINRMVEFKNLSPVNQPADQTVLCAEVTTDCSDLASRVVAEVQRCGLIQSSDVIDTLVLHEKFGYPVYDLNYAPRLANVREKLQPIANLHFLGRAAEFEHLEVDDIFANAVALTNRLVARAETNRIVSAPEGDAMDNHSMPAVCAIVLTYNHYIDTHECLESLQKLDYANLRIVVVDNGSVDGTPDKVRTDFPDVHLIESGQNLGVPWGYNIGFSYALQSGADYVLMLNNDTVVDPQMLTQLVDAGEADPDAGILMPKVLYYDDPETVWAAGGRHRRIPPAHVIIGQGQPSAEFNKPFRLEYALSCGLLIHRRAFEMAGLFDPGYFFQFDDWDFSQRVRDHGLHITFIPDARMWHKVSKSTRETGKEALFWRVWGESSVRFYRRHGRPAAISWPLHLGFLAVRELLKGNRRYLKYFLIGARDGLAKPLGPIPQPGDVIVPNSEAR